MPEKKVLILVALALGSLALIFAIGAEEITNNYNNTIPGPGANTTSGEMWNYTSAGWTFPIPTANIYYNLTNLSAGTLVRTTFTGATQPNGGSYLTATERGLYAVEYHVSFKADGAGGDYAVVAAKNFDQTISRNCYARRAGSTAIGNLGGTCLMYLEVGDTVNLKVEDEDAPSRGIIINNANLNIERLNVPGNQTSVNRSDYWDDLDTPADIDIFVLKAGDTMTGDLTMQASAINFNDVLTSGISFGNSGTTIYDDADNNFTIAGGGASKFFSSVLDIYGTLKGKNNVSLILRTEDTTGIGEANDAGNIEIYGGDAHGNTADGGSIIIHSGAGTEAVTGQSGDIKFYIPNARFDGDITFGADTSVSPVYANSVGAVTIGSDFEAQGDIHGTKTSFIFWNKNTTLRKGTSTEKNGTFFAGSSADFDFFCNESATDDTYNDGITMNYDGSITGISGSFNLDMKEGGGAALRLSPLINGVSVANAGCSLATGVKANYSCDWQQARNVDTFNEGQKVCIGMQVFGLGSSLNITVSKFVGTLEVVYDE